MTRIRHFRSSNEPTDKISHIIGICLLLGLLIPHTSPLLLLVNPIMVIGLFLTTQRKRIYLEARGVLIIVLCISFLFNISSIASVKSILAFANLCILFALFPFVGSRRIPIEYYCIGLGTILFSQIVYIFHIDPIIVFLERVYPISEIDSNSYENMISSIEVNNATAYRLGGVFRNPNQCSRYITLTFSAFLIDSEWKRHRKVIVVFTFLSFLSVLLTGSRTGFVVFIGIILIGLISDDHISTFVKNYIFILIIVATTIISASKLGFRGFNVAQGFENSANSKWSVLIDYLNQSNSIFHLLFGNFDISTFRPSLNIYMSKFDSEYGELIYTYGFIGLVSVLWFYLSTYRRVSRQSRIIFVVLLWMISSTILLSYRMSFLFMLVLSKCYSVNQKKHSNYITKYNI